MGCSLSSILVRGRSHSPKKFSTSNEFKNVQDRKPDLLPREDPRADNTSGRRIIRRFRSSCTRNTHGRSAGFLQINSTNDKCVRARTVIFNNNDETTRTTGRTSVI